jgi:hypothetical protein
MISAEGSVPQFAQQSRGHPPVAEAFHTEHTIDRFRGAPYLSGLRFSREFRIANASRSSTVENAKWMLDAPHCHLDLGWAHYY